MTLLRRRRAAYKSTTSALPPNRSRDDALTYKPYGVN
jgi:hypothetical protein